MGGGSQQLQHVSGPVGVTSFDIFVQDSNSCTDTSMGVMA